jgi:hypothetical protein
MKLKERELLMLPKLPSTPLRMSKLQKLLHQPPKKEEKKTSKNHRT